MYFTPREMRNVSPTPLQPFREHLVQFIHGLVGFRFKARRVLYENIAVSDCISLVLYTKLSIPPEGILWPLVFSERQHLKVENIWRHGYGNHSLKCHFLDLSSDFNMLNAMNMFDCSSLCSELYFLLLTVAEIHTCYNYGGFLKANYFIFCLANMLCLLQVQKLFWGFGRSLGTSLL